MNGPLVGLGIHGRHVLKGIFHSFMHQQSTNLNISCVNSEQTAMCGQSQKCEWGGNSISHQLPRLVQLTQSTVITSLTSVTISSCRGLSPLLHRPSYPTSVI